MSNNFNIKVLEGIFSEDFKSPVYTMLVEEYLKLGDLDRANTVCNIGLENNPDDLGGQYLLAKIFFFQNKINQSKIQLDQILRKFPIHLNARQLMIKILKEEGQDADLLVHVEKLQEYFPNIGAANFSNPNNYQDKNEISETSEDSIEDGETNEVEKRKESFVVSKNMATLTFVEILINQKHYAEALDILDILEKQGKQKKKIKEKRDYIKDRMSK